MEPSSNKNERGDQSADAKDETLPSTTPAVAKPAERENTASLCADKPNKRTRRYERWTEPQVVVNGTLALLGAIGLWIYWSQLIEMRKSTDAATKAAKAAEDGLGLTRDNLLLTARSVDLTAKSLELTQKTTEVSEKTIELTQKSLEATREALGYANKANEISQRGMEAANTPWVDVRIASVKRVGDEIGIAYTIENHSDTPVTRMSAECYLENFHGTLDTNAFSDSNLAIMPRQTISMHSRLFTVVGESKTIVDRINEGKVGLKIYVSGFNVIGKESSFIETFYKIRGTFTVTNTQFNPSWADVLKLIKGDTKKK